jgi:aminoglycoside 3-N-acetyltransferase
MDYATRESLAADLRRLGVSPSGVLLMHSGFKSLGFVAGGPQAAVEALLDAAGTLVVPTHTSDNSDPAEWAHPPVPEAWWEGIRRHTPGFDRARTPAGSYMGRLAELVRTWPGALRSDHPQVSFAAVGPRAAEITAGHRLDDGLGEQSPLGAVYRADGQVLLLGCGHGSNTSLHLAETRIPGAPRHRPGASVLAPDGTSRWTTWSEVDVDESDFEELGAAFEKTGAVTVGQVGAATARLMRQRDLVDFATSWIPAHRGGDWAGAPVTA